MHKIRNSFYLSLLNYMTTICAYVGKLSMNSTANASSTESWNCSTILSSTASKIGRTVAICLILLVSLAGNSLIVMLVYKTPNLRKPINYFVANMAFSDLLYPLFNCHALLSSLHTSWIIGGQLGQALCKLNSLFAEVSAIVSIQSLILIAVDRFGAVVFPLRSPLIRSKWCPFFILATWVVAVAVSSPYLFSVKLVDNSGKMYCTLRWKEAFGESSSYPHFKLVIYILFGYVPVLLLIIIYSFILIKLKQQVHPGEQPSYIEQQRQRRNRNVLHMSIAIISVFVFCWLPFISNFLIINYRSSFMYFSCSFWLYYHVTSYVAAANCAFNPIICFAFSSNYRFGLKRLINNSTGVQQ